VELFLWIWSCVKLSQTRPKLAKSSSPHGFRLLGKRGERAGIGTYTSISRPPFVAPPRPNSKLIKQIPHA
jgi:hypothetical protein